MQISLSLKQISDQAARLIMRAAAGASLDPLQQIRSIPADAESIMRVSTSVRASLIALLDCYYSDMQLRADSLKLTLWSPPWVKHVDSAALSEKLLRLTSLTVAEQLLQPTALAPTAAVYRSQAADEALILIRLLDTVTRPPLPAPERLRRPLHPF